MATFTSWSTLLETELRGKVVEEVKSAELFSVMADTTPDEGHTDRISVVLRYVNDVAKPTERLLDLRKTVDRTGLPWTSTRHPIHVIEHVA